MELLNFGNTKLPSVIKDPFKKQKIESISVTFQDFFGRGNWEATGRIQFKNGDTCGQQNFKGATFDDVVQQIKSVIEAL